jgi:hypothetical protein
MSKNTTNSLLHGTRPNYIGKDLPGVPASKDFLIFDQWLIAFQQYIAIQVSSHVAKCIRLNEWSRPNVPDIMEIAEDDNEATIMMLKLMNDLAIKDYSKRLINFEVDKVKAYDIMVGQLSISSEEFIKRETQNFETEVRGDVIKLILAYRNTHREKSMGLTYMDLVDAEEEFAKFNMGNLNYEDFELLFDSHVRNIDSLGGSKISEDTMVAKFIKKLDPTRYNHLQSSLREGVFKEYYSAITYILKLMMMLRNWYQFSNLLLFQQ